MRVILKTDVPGTGRRGQTLTVPDGFARNYLLPRGFAQLATSQLVQQLERQRQRQQVAESEQQADRRRLLEQLQRLRLTVAAPANPQGRLYGAVTSEQVQAALRFHGVVVDRASVAWPQPIDRLGPAAVTIDLGRGLRASVPLTVVAEGTHA
ncbi:MAG: 50S ribosomal protein L9 [Candidatus Kerfeldbacteria bacterium]|nr:50S ribosomal protein L9 [Candidatus Kerfeldbacteria bacterium]